MATIQIPDELDQMLEQAATRSGCSKEDLLRDAIEARLEEQNAVNLDFTPEQIERMRHSIAQLERGEVVTSEQVDAKFEDWRRRRASH